MTILITNRKRSNKLMMLSHVVVFENRDGSYDILKNRFEASPNHFETENDLNNYIQELTLKEEGRSSRKV